MNCEAVSHPVSHSRTEQVHIVMPGDCNQYFRLFGGQLMHWIDTVAAVVARRHSGKAVTTASIDKLDFLSSATLNDLVVLQGRVLYTGRTSMLVAVETFVEAEQCQTRRLVNRATLTMVALGEDNNPVQVPRLAPETEAEITDYETGKALYEAKKAARSL
ncbi:MAG TPA: acyl-CoA thioesterase [Candidatus Limiplasma sp.]|nr:acyl-CoA thioesterase [Candidatus Limiplasma sp.]